MRRNKYKTYPVELKRIFEKIANDNNLSVVDVRNVIFYTFKFIKEKVISETHIPDRDTYKVFKIQHFGIFRINLKSYNKQFKKKDDESN